MDGIDEQAQQMKLRAVIVDRKFRTRHGRDRLSRRRRQKILQTVGSIMVGQSNGGKSKGKRFVDQFRRGAGAVGKDGVVMKVAVLFHKGLLVMIHSFRA